MKEGNNNVLQFKLYGSDSYVEVALLGGLNMTFSNFSNDEHKVTADTPLTLTATLMEVVTVVISPTSLDVKLENNGTLTIRSGTTISAGEYTIYFEIYNKAGYRC